LELAISIVSGKTTLARSTFPEFEYVSLEELSARRRVEADPRAFLRGLERSKGAILDEVQYVPELFSYVQSFVDDRRGGPLILTGSQQFLLSERIAQSLSGRTAILELLPFSLAEIRGRSAVPPSRIEDREPGSVQFQSAELDGVLLTGGFSPIHDRSLEPGPWLDGYVRTYVERDVRPDDRRPSNPPAPRSHLRELRVHGAAEGIPTPR
jgi:predicted AAA+ superfamily ATPase